MEELPIIDVAPLVTGQGDVRAVAAAIDAACRAHGFFYIAGHGVPAALEQRLDDAARAFFALPDAQKAAMAMDKGGRAWRGWFPFEGELTSGRADRKEGIYFGAELDRSDPRVRAGIPLHGPNLFPAEVPELRGAVLDHLDAHDPRRPRRAPGHGARPRPRREWFHDNLTADPLVLFRIFRYPPEAGVVEPNWGSRSTPTTGCSPSWARTTTTGSRCTLRPVGSRRRRSRARSCATSATCSNG